MLRKDFILGENDSGRRLDRVLKKLLAEKPASAVFSAVRKGLLKINGKKTDASYITNEGDVLSVAEFLLTEDSGKNKEAKSKMTDSSDRSPGSGRDEKLDPKERKDIGTDGKEDFPDKFSHVFKNGNLLIIDKQRGIPVQGADSVAEFFSGRKTDSISFTQAPLHRLDRGTSGLLAVSQSLAGAQWFSRNIKNHSIKKFYFGIVLGSLEKKEVWYDKIAKRQTDGDGGFHTVQVLTEKGNSALKEEGAETIAEPVKHGTFNGREITLVRFEILTGKKHQIRAQSAFHGHPLLGDTAYQKNEGGRPRSFGGFFLHASRMEFPENDLGIPPFVESEIPLYFPLR